MRGKEFLTKLEATFPGITAKFYVAVKLGRDADEVVARTWGPLAEAVGAILTAEMLAKHRHSLGVRAFRQPHRGQNGTRPDIPPALEPDATVEQQLPLAASEAAPPTTA